jgi:poly(3-hydroxyalkanoate) synthetase
MRPEAPAPLRRRGPRPIWLHLASGPQANPSPAGIDPELVAGIAAYRRHPYVRTLQDPPVIWSEGDSRLLDFGGAGPPVLFVPSLINRAYVLDLMPGRSMLRWLAATGVRPLLLDWGWPGPAERTFTMTDVIAGRLERAILAVGEKLVLAGYCMGGLLALAASLRLQDRVRALALLATPWDFHADNRDESIRLAAQLPALEPLLLATGTLPIDALQVLFAQIEPGSVAAKYRRFARAEQDGVAAEIFVAMEDWLNDGVPLAAPVARQCLQHWYGENQPGRAEWRIDGARVDPAALRIPAYVAAPARDRIVPPKSAAALAHRIPRALLHQPAAGHIGMAAGPRAEEALWTPLLGWLRAL